MKKLTFGRQLAAEGLVALSACAAAYFFLVEPVRAKLTEVQRDIRQASVTPAPTPGAAITPEEARKILDEVQSRTAAVELRSALAKDESALFASLMSLAAAHNIRVDGLTPVGNNAGEQGKTRRGSSEQAVPPPPPPPGVELPEPPPVDTKVEFVMSTVSSYTDLIRFVEALQNSTGYTVIKSVKLEPADDAIPDRVRASIETIHLAFDTSKVVAERRPGGAP